MEALDHLRRVLRREIEDSASLAGYLDLVAKEAVLKKDRDGVNEAIAWGVAQLTQDDSVAGQFGFLIVRGL